MSASREELQSFLRKQNPKTSHVPFEHWRDSDHDGLVRLAEWRQRREEERKGPVFPLSSSGGILLLDATEQEQYRRERHPCMRDGRGTP